MVNGGPGQTNRWLCDYDYVLLWEISFVLEKQNNKEAIESTIKTGKKLQRYRLWSKPKNCLRRVLFNDRHHTAALGSGSMRSQVLYSGFLANIK